MKTGTINFKLYKKVNAMNVGYWDEFGYCNETWLEKLLAWKKAILSLPLTNKSCDIYPTNQHCYHSRATRSCLCSYETFPDMRFCSKPALLHGEKSSTAADMLARKKGLVGSAWHLGFRQSGVFLIWGLSGWLISRHYGSNWICVVFQI